MQLRVLKKLRKIGKERKEAMATNEQEITPFREAIAEVIHLFIPVVMKWWGVDILGARIAGEKPRLTIYRLQVQSSLPTGCFSAWHGASLPNTSVGLVQSPP